MPCDNIINMRQKDCIITVDPTMYVSQISGQKSRRAAPFEILIKNLVQFARRWINYLVVNIRVNIVQRSLADNKDYKDLMKPSR